MRNFYILLLTLCPVVATASKPKYASKETKEVIAKMIAAHGGLNAWKKAKTFSFTNVMYSASLPGSPFWVNEITVEKSTERVYQLWPLHNAEMAYDGEKAWGVNWKIGNPPKFEALFFYYFLNLPWLTQQDHINLGEVKKVNHNAFDKEVYEIEMTFNDPPIGKTKKDKFVLYIDSETHLLVGYKYFIGYGHMLDIMRVPADREVFGPMFRTHQAFTEVEGLVYPALMQTGNEEQTQVYGNHAIYNYSLNKPFDESKMAIPDGAVVDSSSEVRKER